METTNRYEVVNHSGTPVVLISYTVRGGKLDGVTLHNGRIGTHPEAGAVVRFNYYHNERMLKGKLAKGQDALIKLDGKPELAALAAEASAALAAEEARVAAAAAALEPIGLRWTIGCDVADTYTILLPPYDEKPILWRRSEDFRQVEADIRTFADWKRLKAIAEETGAEALDAGYTSYGGWVFGPEGLARVLAHVAERQAEVQAKRDRSATARAEKVAAAMAEAKATGKPALLDQWDEECDGSTDECDVDNCYRYAMPDGSTTVERVHTY